MPGTKIVSTASRTKELQAAWYQGLSEAAAGVLVHLSGSGRTTYVSRAITAVLGWTPKEAREQGFFGIVEADDHETLRQALVRAHAAGGREVSVDFRIQHKDLRVLFVRATAVRASDDTGSPGILLQLLDVTETRQREAKLAEHARWLQKLTGNSGEVITVVGPERDHAFVGGNALELLGWTPDEWTMAAFESSIHEFDRARTLGLLDTVLRSPGAKQPIQYRLRRKDGTLLHVETIATNLADDPDIAGCVLYTRDITRQVVQDALTGLPNRILFDERARSAFEQWRKKRRDLFAIVLLRVDRYELVSAGLGPGPADQLLIRFAQRVQESLREGDLLARYSTDVFALLLTDLSSPDAATGLTDRIRQSLERSFNLYGQDVHTGVAIGMALTDRNRPSVDVMLRDAEKMLTREAARRRPNTSVADTQMLEEMTSRLELEAELRKALKTGGLDVHYQPIISLRSGGLAGFEALVRWNHPRRGFIPPDRFIPLAEETELIGLVGEYVLDRACSQLSGWQRDHDTAHDVFMSVNVSAREFQGNLVDRVLHALQDHGLAPAHLKLEVTETALIAHPTDAERTLSVLADLGVLLAIDDFGTGYASLGALNRFPFGTLKIDRSFVSGPTGMEESGRSMALVRTIIQMARALGLQVVAEGIETRRQAELLQSMRCALGQGWFFSRAVPAAEATALLTKAMARVR